MMRRGSMFAKMVGISNRDVDSHYADMILVRAPGRSFHEQSAHKLVPSSLVPGVTSALFRRFFPSVSSIHPLVHQSFPKSSHFLPLPLCLFTHLVCLLSLSLFVLGSGCHRFCPD